MVVIRKPPAGGKPPRMPRVSSATSVASDAAGGEGGGGGGGGGNDDFIERLKHQLSDLRARLEDDAEAFHVDLADSVRALSNRLRPLTKVEYLLDTQDELDVLKREARKHVAKMISQSQEMLDDAHVHLNNFQKMKNLMRMIQLRHVRAAFESWTGHCSAEAAAERAKWEQPAVQAFLRRILTNSGTGAFYSWYGTHLRHYHCIVGGTLSQRITTSTTNAQTPKDPKVFNIHWYVLTLQAFSSSSFFRLRRELFYSICK